MSRSPASISSPVPQSTTPALYPAYPYSYPAGVPVAPVKQTARKPKPVNVFSNDGSFLERIQRSRREEEEKRKAKEAFEAKIHFEDRFKRRGKRPAPDSVRTQNPTDHPVKKPRAETNQSTTTDANKRDSNL